MLLKENVPAAIAEFRQALRLDPQYLNAVTTSAVHSLLAATWKAHARSTKIFLRKKPAYADAQAGLGTVYFKQKNFADALIHFREAVRLDPQNADTQANLGTLFAKRGELSAAKNAFQAALQIDPGHQAARANL